MRAQFKDRAREKQRQRLLAQRALQRAEDAAAAAAKQGAAGGTGRGRPGGGSSAAAAPKQERRLPAAKRRALDAVRDEEDFADDYRALKKVKKGKISEVGT
jgi:ATP-dependent RNA helicase DDX55/SPB4